MSCLGVRLKNLTVSSIGQADDTLLLSNNIFALSYLLELTSSFCSKYLVTLSAEKTRLQVYRASKHDAEILNNPIRINDKPVPFCGEAEHVGILRSTEGNGPAILSRLASHRKALASILHTGLAKGHRGNPMSSIRIHQLYAVPVLFSGIPSLVLSANEINTIDRYFCETLRKLLRLMNGTPRCVTYFLAGSLPGSAILHMRQLSLFGMICRLRDNILHKHAMNYFSSISYFKGSWFEQIRNWCLLYSLPHPLSLLYHPLPKESFKLLLKKSIVSYWECKLRSEAASLTSLKYLHAPFMSLRRIHPLFWTAGNSPRQVSMAMVQAVMISGRYRCGALTRHWSSSNDGSCTLSSECHGILEDVHHILIECPSLHPIRENLRNFTRNFLQKQPDNIQQLVLTKCSEENPFFSQFLLDCSVDVDVIKLVQEFGADALRPMFLVTRTWVYLIHRHRLKLLGLWR